MKWLVALTGVVAVLAMTSSAIGKTRTDAGRRTSPTQNVLVTNTAAQPVPTAIVGTPSVSIEGTPSVSVSGTPSVTLSGTPSVAVTNTPTVNVVQTQTPFQQFVYGTATNGETCQAITVPAGKRITIESFSAEVDTGAGGATPEVFILTNARQGGGANLVRALALDLAGGSARLRTMTYRRGEARAALADAEAADLVVASYVFGEISDAERSALADMMWARTRDTLLIVEPGTPAGYARIIALRAQLIASGAHVAAPCPHDGKCPLITPDWCHFTQRLPRSRAHKQLKAAELPYEDEKFIYVALTRAPMARRPARVLAQPVVTKIAVTAKLCTNHGVVSAIAPRRDKTAYARSRKYNWGDGVFETGKPSTE